MGAAGRPGRGERARVAARVRELVGASADTDPLGGDPADGSRAWVPGMPARQGVEPASRWRSRLRWDPGRRGVAALGLALVVVVAATGWWLAAGRPTAMPIAASGGGPSAAAPVLPSASVPQPTAGSVSAGGSVPTGVPASSSSPVPAAGSTTPTTVVVDVAGKVRRPGVYTLPAGTRVFDALRAAGGARRGASTTALNLAEPLQDGEQIVVGGPGSGVSGGTLAVGSTAAAGTGAAGAPVDLNSATLEQLEALPGIGPVLGQNILDWRSQHGQFTSVDQLQDVSGIGPAKLGEIKGLVSL